MKLKLQHLCIAFALALQAPSQTPTLANSDDIAAAKNRANHTGTQAWSTLTGTPTTLNGYGITDGLSDASDIATALGYTPLANTNAAVNTAIADDPSTTREALGAEVLLQNKAGLAAAFEAFQQLDTGAVGKYVAIAKFGDSLCGRYWMTQFIGDLEKTWGCGAWTSPNLEIETTTPPYDAWQLTGSASLATSDYTILPSTGTVLIPASSTATWRMPHFGGAKNVVVWGSSSLTALNLPHNVNRPFLNGGCRKIKLYYLKNSSSGIFDVTFTQDLITPQVTSGIDAYSATEALGTLEITPDDRYIPADLLISHVSGGSVTILGAVAFGESGVFSLGLNKGGVSMEPQLACLRSGSLNTPLADMLNDLGVRLVVHAQRCETDFDWQAAYESFFDAFATDLSSPTQLVIGEGWTSSEGTPVDRAEQNTYLENECRSRGFPFFDTFKAMPSWDEMTILGWNTDSSHYTEPAHRFQASALLREVGNFRSALSPRVGGGGTTMWTVAKNRFELFARDEMLTHRIIGSASSVVDGASNSVWSQSVDNLNGFYFLGTAADGYTASRIGHPHPSYALATNKMNFLCGFTAYQGPTLPAGARAMVVFGGGTTTRTSPSAIAERCFGVEMARSGDVGSPQGSTDVTEICGRLFFHNGSTLTYGAWSPIEPPNSNNAAGINVLIKWSLKEGVLTLGGSPVGVVTDNTQTINYPCWVTSLAAIDLQSNATSRGYVHAALYSDGVTTPGSAASMKIKTVFQKYGNEGLPTNANF